MPGNDFFVEISVILTVYNRAAYLNRCINSLLKQNFFRWELITVDDGSTDNSLEVLRFYKENYPGIRIFHQENKGLAESRNRGIRLSKSKYITFLDSDDEYEEAHLKKRISYMNNHPEIDLIHGGIKITGSEFVRDKDNPLNFIHLSKCTVGATFFGKRNLFTSLGGFRNLNYSEDSEFLLRAENTFTVRKVHFPTYIYHRELSDSLTNSYIPLD